MYTSGRRCILQVGGVYTSGRRCILLVGGVYFRYVLLEKYIKK